MELLKMEDLEPDVQENIRKLYPGREFDLSYIGDVKCVMPITYKDHADAVRAMKVRPDDIWIISFPRSGTTWTQEMVWLLENSLDYEKASQSSVFSRFNFLEYYSVLPDKYRDILKKIMNEPSDSLIKVGHEVAETAPSPRFFKTHLPLSLLPPTLLDTAKVVYVARDPRDVVVSYYHHSRLINWHGYRGDFRTFWDLFTKNLTLWSPYFSTLKEAWAQRDNPNMMFLFYEDMQKDLKSSLDKMCTFLGKKYSDEELYKLCDHLHIDNMKQSKSIQPSWIRSPEMVSTQEQKFIRIGKTGSWQDSFDEEMTLQAQSWIEENLKGTGLCFS